MAQVHVHQTTADLAPWLGMVQIIPLSSSQGSPIVQSHMLDLAPAPSNAEQSLMARGLSSVYDPNQDAEDQTAKPAADARAIIALTASPSEALDNRSVICSMLELAMLLMMLVC